MLWEIQKRINLFLVKNEIWETIEYFPSKPTKKYMDELKNKFPNKNLRFVKVEDQQ